MIKIVMVLFFIGMIVVNYLANSLPLGGVSTGEISDRYNTLFTPSGFTFSIWGLIYILVGIFVFNYALKSDADVTVGYLFILTCILNISWLFCWHYDKIILSTIVMIVFLVTLLALVTITSSTKDISYITFSVYAGWISVALIANISILIFKYDISIFMNHEYIWLYVILFVSVLIGGYMVFIKKHIFYGLVFLWAYFGIAMKFISK